MVYGSRDPKYAESAIISLYELFDHLFHQFDPRVLAIADLHVVESLGDIRELSVRIRRKGRPTKTALRTIAAVISGLPWPAPYADRLHSSLV
jgi:hypothetical protein